MTQKAFITDDFLLQGATARRLYHTWAADQPILDFHCHLPPRDLAANRRFATMGQGRFVGGGPEVHDAYAALAEQGVERFYCWFTDFADPRTLEAFGATVIDQFR